MKKPTAIKDYVFRKDLHDTPLSITTFFYNKSWVTMIENIPTLTFRGKAMKQDVLGVNKDYKEAMKFHKEKVKETEALAKEVNQNG